MINFGERIAYWYLRLQGFLIAEDFVMHGGERLDRTADADLLAVRLKHSEESIDGTKLTLDAALVTALRLAEKHAAVVVQVKTGQQGGPGQAFNRARINYGLRFIGAIPVEQVERLELELECQATAEVDDWIVAKLLFAEEPLPTYVAITVRLDTALGFINARLRAHSQRKATDRLTFSDELMQFLAWSANRRPEEA